MPFKNYPSDSTTSKSKSEKKNGILVKNEHQRQTVNIEIILRIIFPCFSFLSNFLLRPRESRLLLLRNFWVTKSKKKKKKLSAPRPSVFAPPRSESGGPRAKPGAPRSAPGKSAGQGKQRPRTGQQRRKFFFYRFVISYHAENNLIIIIIIIF